MHQMPQGIPGESVEAQGRRQLDVAHESTVAEQPLVGIWQCGAVEEADIDMCRERIDVTQRDSLHADRGMAVMQACMDIGTSGGPCLQPDFREILQFDGTTTCEPIRDIGGGRPCTIERKEARGVHRTPVGMSPSLVVDGVGSRS